MRKRRGTQSRSGDYSQVLSQSYSASAPPPARRLRACSLSVNNKRHIRSSVYIGVSLEFLFSTIVVFSFYTTRAEVCK